MPRPLQPTDFLRTGVPILDVRSPAEFAQGHIPGAKNIPLFSNAERATVGTLYKQKGHDAAVMEGLRIVGPKLATIAEAARTIASDGKIGVHCWRGGERSGSTAWLLEKAGIQEVSVLKGGYQAFRNYVLSSFATRYSIRVLGGYTGTGKTELLAMLKDRGEQVIDLEAFANHKGSTYGAIGEEPQPSTEHFENMLWNVFRTIDPTRTLWVEDESMMIGRTKIPNAFFTQMRIAPCYFVDMPREERAEHLVRVYGAYPREELVAATKRIEKRIGPQHCKTALAALANGDLYTVAMLTLNYYDKTYLHGIEKRTKDKLMYLPASRYNMNAIVDQLLATEAKTHVN